MCAGDSPPIPNSTNDHGLKALWIRGRFWEILGFTKGNFNALEILHNHSILSATYRYEPGEIRVLDDAFAILNAPVTRQFYEGCRATMQIIRKEIGDIDFEHSETEIWGELWGWVSTRWQTPPAELVRQLVLRYAAEEKGLLDKERLDAFKLSKCSSCKSFYESLLSCPLNRDDWHCSSFESISTDERQTYIGQVKWQAKMQTVMERVQKEGIVAKCRQCGTIYLNPNTFVCEECGGQTLSCPSCQHMLKFDIAHKTWSCTNEKCHKRFAYRHS
jgi:hypothetical protein